MYNEENLGLEAFLFSIWNFISLFYLDFYFPPSITDGVHRNENFVEIIPDFQLFEAFSKKKYIYIKVILCNFSMRLLKYF